MGSIHCVGPTLWVYKLGCKAAMKERGDDHLEGAHSLCHFKREISHISWDFWGTLTEMGSIHCTGVETWLLLGENLPHFGGLLGTTYRDGFYTLGKCTNLAPKQP